MSTPPLGYPAPEPENVPVDPYEQAAAQLGNTYPAQNSVPEATTAYGQPGQPAQPPQVQYAPPGAIADNTAQKPKRGGKIALVVGVVILVLALIGGLVWGASKLLGGSDSAGGLHDFSGDFRSGAEESWNIDFDEYSQALVGYNPDGTMLIIYDKSKEESTIWDVSGDQAAAVETVAGTGAWVEDKVANRGGIYDVTTGETSDAPWTSYKRDIDGFISAGDSVIITTADDAVMAYDVNGELLW